MRRVIFTVVMISGAALAAEDPHAGHQMPAKPAADDPHAEHQMPPAKTNADPHAGHVMPAKPDAPAFGSAPPADFAADKVFGAEAMAAARQLLHHEHGAHVFSKVMVDTLEYAGGREDGYRWDAEAWIGGDINRAVFRTEGAGAGGLHEAEVQALYSRAIGPYFDLQAGLRHDFEPGPSRSYAAIGVEGLAPYWFDVEAAAFLSDKGDLLARLGASYDQLITQRLVIQPRAEVNFAARDMAAQGIGSGLSDFELGLRLRYEIRREFAPYVGVSYERKTGRTADFARASGEAAGGTRFVIGIRAWF
jgi:copper resistance protein B